MLKNSEKLVPYESVLILKADTSEENQKKLLLKNKQIIESFKGSMNHVDTWGKRRLGNPIHREKIGLYFHTTFTATSQVIMELERTMKINQDVLRYIHIKLEEGTDLAKHVQDFKDVLSANLAREKEREKNFLATRAQKQMRPSTGSY